MSDTNDPGTSVDVLTGVCLFCDKIGTVTMTSDQYKRYLVWKAHRLQHGSYIQDALPDLSVDDREQLMTGTHGACFDATFPPEEE